MPSNAVMLELQQNLGKCCPKIDCCNYQCNRRTAWPHPLQMQTWQRNDFWWSQNITFTIARILCHIHGHQDDVLIVYQHEILPKDHYVWTTPLQDVDATRIRKVLIVALQSRHYMLTVVDCVAGPITTQDGYLGSSRSKCQRFRWSR